MAKCPPDTHAHCPQCHQTCREATTFGGPPCLICDKPPGRFAAWRWRRAHRGLPTDCTGYQMDPHMMTWHIANLQSTELVNLWPAASP